MPGQSFSAKGKLFGVVFALAGIVLGASYFGGPKTAIGDDLASMSLKERMTYYAAQNRQIEGMTTGLESNALAGITCDLENTQCYAESYKDLYDSVVSALPYAQTDFNASWDNFVQSFVAQGRAGTAEQGQRALAELQKPRSGNFDAEISAFFSGMGFPLDDNQLGLARVVNEMANNVRIRQRFIDMYEARIASQCSKEGHVVTMTNANTTYTDECIDGGAKVRNYLCTENTHKPNNANYIEEVACEFGCFESECRPSPAFAEIEMVMGDNFRPGEAFDVTILAKDIDGEIDVDYESGDLELQAIGFDLAADAAGAFELEEGKKVFDEVISADQPGTHTLRVLKEDGTVAAQVTFTVIQMVATDLVVDITKQIKGTGDAKTADVDVRVEAHDVTDRLLEEYSSDKIRFTLLGADLDSQYAGHMEMENGVLAVKDMLTAIPVGTYTLMVSDDSVNPALTGKVEFQVLEGTDKPACATQNITVNCMAKGNKSCTTTEACPAGCIAQALSRASYETNRANAGHARCYRTADLTQVLTKDGWKLQGENSCFNATKPDRELELKSKCIATPAMK